jgi:hypothetical protein
MRSLKENDMSLCNLPIIYLRGATRWYASALSPVWLFGCDRFMYFQIYVIFYKSDRTDWKEANWGDGNIIYIYIVQINISEKENQSNTDSANINAKHTRRRFCESESYVGMRATKRNEIKARSPSEHRTDHYTTKA